LDPPDDDGFESFLAVLDSASLEEEVSSVLGFLFGPLAGPRPKENIQFCPCEISKWLNIDMNILRLVKEVIVE
jgi:hypothetical protein